MDNIRDRAKHLVDNAIKGTMIDENGNKVEHPDKGKPANGYRLEYSFGDDYTDRITHQNLQPALTEIKGATLILLPAEKEPMPSSKLKDFGIEGYIDNNGKSNFYATDYGTRISDGSEYRAVEYSYADEKNKNKLISSFTNDPIKQLFADLRSYDTTSSTATDKGGTGTDITPNAGIFSDGTYPYSYHEFPEFYLDEESRLESLKVNKEVITEELKSGRKELDQAEKDYQEDRKQLFAQEKELDDKINAKITELRKELKDKFKVSDTETNDFTGDNRITTIEHYNFQRLVRNLRFLAKNDEEAPTGKTNEDQAYSSSENICSQALELEKLVKLKKKDGQAKFDNLASLKTLLEKVCVKKADGTIEKVEDNFITALKKLKTKKVDGTEEEGQIDTLAKLVEKKDPVEVIKIITHANGKYLDDADLTDEEITNTLYEIAIGKKTLATQRKVDETNGNENPNTEKNGSAEEEGGG
ncbi:38906_t:CDS:2, partial [Gigaspora margarita]